MHAAGCISAIIVGPVDFHVYCKLDAGIDIKRLNACVTITLADAQGYFAASHSYLLQGAHALSLIFLKSGSSQAMFAEEIVPELHACTCADSVLTGGPQSLAFWDVASVRVNAGAGGESAPQKSEDDEYDEQEASAVTANDADSPVSFEVEGKNSMVDDEPYMNLVQWLVVDEAGVGLKGAKITIGTGGGDASVIVAHLTTDKNGLATIRLPWAA